MGRKLTRHAPFAEYGRRLRAARLALGYEILDHYAKKAGIPPKYYSMHETGVHLITIERAKALKRTYDLSFDYIFDGDMDNLPRKLVEKISELLPTL